MAGIEVSEEMTNDQLFAMCGGELLRQEVVNVVTMFVEEWTSHSSENNFVFIVPVNICIFEA